MPVPARLQRANPIFQRRVGGGQPRKGIRHAVGEEHVAGVFRARMGDERAAAADFFQRAGQCPGVARELNRGGVRQELPGAVHRALDQRREDPPNVPDHPQQRADQGKRIAVSPRSHENAPEQRDVQNPEDQTHQVQVQAHVPVQDVAELVSNDALQFVARQQDKAAARHADDHVAGGMAGGEGVDAALRVQYVHRGHRSPRGDGHLLHHVQQFVFIGVGGVCRNEAAAEHFRDDLSAARKLDDFVRAAAKNEREGDGRNDQEELGVPKAIVLRGIILVITMAAAWPPIQDQHHDEVDGRGNAQDGKAEINFQEFRVLAGALLTVKEVHKDINYKGSGRRGSAVVGAMSRISKSGARGEIGARGRVC